MKWRREGRGGDRKAEVCNRRPGDGGGKQPRALEQEQRFIERTIQSVQGLVRTWRSSLEAKWGVKLDVKHRKRPSLVEMVGWMDDVEGRRGS